MGRWDGCVAIKDVCVHMVMRIHTTACAQHLELGLHGLQRCLQCQVLRHGHRGICGLRATGGGGGAASASWAGSCATAWIHSSPGGRQLTDKHLDLLSLVSNLGSSGACGSSCVLERLHSQWGELGSCLGT